MTEQPETHARFTALHKALGRAMENPKGRYFDPPFALEFFNRWTPIRDAMKSLYPTLLEDLPVRELPVSSGTSDHEGRGYIERRFLQRLLDDMQYVHDAFAAMPSVSVPSMKVTREGVFFAGQYFDALREVAELVASAKKRLSLVDGYVNADTLSLLSGRNASVHVEILTKDAPPKLIVAAQAFMKQFGSLGIRTSHAFHDRFLLLDDADVYHFGASIKDLGHRGFMFSRVEEPDVIAAILAKYEKEWKGAVAII